VHVTFFDSRAPRPLSVGREREAGGTRGKVGGGQLGFKIYRYGRCKEAQQGGAGGLGGEGHSANADERLKNPCSSARLLFFWSSFRERRSIF